MTGDTWYLVAIEFYGARQWSTCFRGRVINALGRHVQ